MKQLIILICCLVCIAAAASCTAQDQGGDPSAIEAPQSTPVEPNEAANADANVEDLLPAKPEPLTMERDMGISVKGLWYPIWQQADALLQALGGDYVLTAAPSCVFEGEDKEFAYESCFVFTNPDGDRDIWYSIYLIDDEYSTARGISVGSAYDDIVDSYGDGGYWEGETILTYSISGQEGDIASPCIQFTVEDDLVTAIEIYYPTNVT